MCIRICKTIHQPITINQTPIPHQPSFLTHHSLMPILRTRAHTLHHHPRPTSFQSLLLRTLTMKCGPLFWMASSANFSTSCTSMPCCCCGRSSLREKEKEKKTSACCAFQEICRKGERKKERKEERREPPGRFVGKCRRKKRTGNGYTR